MISTTLALLLGALLVFAGILGGGFEIKELKVPKIGAFTRFLSVSVGIFFILVGIILENESVFNLVSETFNKEQAEVSTPSTGEDLNNNPPVVPLPRYVSKPGDSSGYSAVAHCTRTGVTGNPTMRRLQRMLLRWQLKIV